MATAVRFEAISKHFPGVLALDRVTVEVAAGSCHALCGENGAGKSTLGKILAGIHRPDRGHLLVHGRRVAFTSPRDAARSGVAMVHQELAFCDNLTVAENLCLGRLPARRGLIQRDEMQGIATTMMDAVGAPLEVDRPLGQLTIAQRQLVQIAAAVGAGASIIVFDEPTSSLGHAETERVYQLVGRLKAAGVTCVYVSHRMPEVFALADTVTVLRDGSHVATRPTKSLTEPELVSLMIGRTIPARRPRHARTSLDEVLGVKELRSPGKFGPVSLSLYPGEVVGIAGLIGAGRSELALALFGLDRAAGGQIRVNGHPVAIRTAADAIRLGIGLVPEDRKRQGLIPRLTTLENITLPSLKRVATATWIGRSRERARVEAVLQGLSVRRPPPDSVVETLSGGNQQKVVLARWLAAESRILILDEPTRGVDIGAKAEIHAQIAHLADEGRAILIISSELPELLTVADRILVLRDGLIAGQVAGDEATEEELLRLMAGLPTPSHSSVKPERSR